MSGSGDSFDGYYKWLGIHPEDQPPDHYRLLGIRRFEEDADVIDAAAERQMVHVKRYQTGPRGRLSQRLLGEISAARARLLDAKQKTDYDRKLRNEAATLRRGGAETPIDSPGEQSSTAAHSAVLPPRVPVSGPEPRMAVSGPLVSARNDDPEDPFADEIGATPEEELREALREVLADGVIDDDERAEVKRLRRLLGVPADRASAIFAEVKAEPARGGAAVRADRAASGKGEPFLIVADSADSPDDDVVELELADVIPPPTTAGPSRLRMAIRFREPCGVNVPVRLYFDGRLLGRASTRGGFRLVVEADEGMHDVTVKTPRGQTTYTLMLDTGLRYAVDLLFDPSRGVFHDRCEVTVSPG